MAKVVKPKQTNRDSLRDTLTDAMFTSTEQVGWQRTTMKVIAETAGVPLADAIAAATTPLTLLAHAMRRADRAALAEIDGFDEGETIRGRLFALLMARFDAIAPYRAGIRATLRGAVCDPALQLTLAVQGHCSMKRMLEAAGLSTKGPVGCARTKGLMLVSANTMRTWVNDDTVDLARTMATLDKGLARAESLALSLYPTMCRPKSTTAGDDGEVTATS